MNKRRKFTALLGILICVVLLMSCKKNDTGEETYELYYVNVQTQALEQEKVQIEGDTTEEKIESMLKELKKNPEDVEVKSTFPKKIKVEKWELTNGRLGISFNQEYKNVKKVPELLFRASLVQSLIQIDGVDSVKLYIGGDPLCDANGNEIGAMNSIVNSIIRGGSASKVQILVNGDSNLKYQDQVDLSQPLTEREDIVED